MSAIRYISHLVSTAIVVGTISCSSHKQGEVSDSEILVSVGDSSLRMADVLLRMPRGLTPEDSTAMFNRIVDGWVRNLVLSEYAQKNIPDLDKIDRLTEAFRNNLIVNSYLNSMIEQGKNDVSEERVRQYFEANRENMVLDEPVIKGAFLKVGESVGDIDHLRAWMSEFSESSIDKVEEAGLKYASTYNYFKDEWRPWSSVAEQIPYRFFDADAFVRSTRDFETNDAGSIYLLHISDYLLSGTEMPYEYARDRIREILVKYDLGKRQEKLIADIYRKQIKEGVLRPGIYDPLGHKLKTEK